MNITYILTILIIILIIYYTNIYDKRIDEGDKIKLYIFDVISVCFLLLFMFYGYIRGTEYGFLLSVFIWAIFVCTTPIPETGLLLSLPLKHFFNIPMDISQIFISFFGLILLYLFYMYFSSLLKTILIGKMFHKIISLRLYSLFFYSIIASITGAYVLNILIDSYVLNKKNRMNIPRMILALGVIILLNILYFYTIIRYKIMLTR